MLGETSPTKNSEKPLVMASYCNSQMKKRKRDHSSAVTFSGWVFSEAAWLHPVRRSHGQAPWHNGLPFSQDQDLSPKLPRPFSSLLMKGASPRNDVPLPLEYSVAKSHIQ